MIQSNKQLALSLAIETLKTAPNIERNQGDWVLDLAKKYENFLNEDSIALGRFDVLLHSHGNSALNTIKLVKDVTGMNFMDSKELVVQLPKIIKHNVSDSEAIMIKNQFAWTGAAVSIEKCSTK